MINQSFQEIALMQIRPSPWNPRKKFAGPEFKELIESIRQQGVIQPVLVRPVVDDAVGYELVFGERRLRASIVVANDNGGPAENTIPALVRELDDDQAFELTTIENLQREDLDELEEADGFKMFIDRKGEDSLPDLAERTGKDIRFIRRRLAVLALPKKILKSWQSGDLKYGHLQQLLRIGDKNERIDRYRDILEINWHGIMSVKDLKREIDSTLPKLKDAVFDPEKEGCHACRKNSDVQKKLFGMDELDKTHCLDPKCFKKKQNDYLTGHWQETQYHDEFGTNGFRFKESVGYGDSKDFYGIRILKKCKQCDNFITIIYAAGREYTDKACLKPKCYKATYNKAANKNSPENGVSSDKGAPRVDWHGEYFREKFYRAQIPEKINGLKATMDTPDALMWLDRISLFTILKQNPELHEWFSDRMGSKIDNHCEGIKDRDLFGWLSGTGIGDLQQLIREALGRVVSLSHYGPDARRAVADHIGIDLSKEWRMDEEYCNKKTKAELMDIGEKFGIFADEKAKTYLFEKLNKKRGKYSSCKKTELIDVFMESGVDLVGKVPDEILVE